MSDPHTDALARAEGRIGAVLRGKYRLDRLLGVGGMAAVYEATHRNRKRFAVKVLHPELSLRADIRSRFLREGYAANSVEHPGAVSVLDDDVDEAGVAFLVMELLDGETAEEMWVRAGEVLPLPVALSIGHQVLDVLASAHAHGVVHRDVKPANLFLTRGGQLKLLDFGIARVRDAATSHHGTQAGSVMGTAGFMAPEQALGRGEQVDALTDVWAVGATIFTLASGQLVHDQENPQEAIVQSATKAAPSFATVRPDAPPAIVKAIDRALAFEKENRWPSAAAMRDAIGAASRIEFGDLPSLPPTVAAPEGPRRRPRPWTLFLLAGITVAALALTVVSSVGRHSAAGDPTPASSLPAAQASGSPPLIAVPPAASSLPATDLAPSVPSKPNTPPLTPGKKPTSAPASRPSCTPPFYFDEQGNRVFRKECL